MVVQRINGLRGTFRWQEEMRGFATCSDASTPVPTPGLRQKRPFSYLWPQLQLTLSSLLNLDSCYIESRALTRAEFTAPPPAHALFRSEF